MISGLSFLENFYDSTSNNSEYGAADLRAAIVWKVGKNIELNSTACSMLQVNTIACLRLMIILSPTQCFSRRRLRGGDAIPLSLLAVLTGLGLTGCGFYFPGFEGFLGLHSYIHDIPVSRITTELQCELRDFETEAKNAGILSQSQPAGVTIKFQTDQSGTFQYVGINLQEVGLSVRLSDLKRDRCGRRSPMTYLRQPPGYRFSIDHGVNGEPPAPWRHSTARQCGPSYLWNGTHQQLIEILPEDHPNYRENREMISETIRRWNRGTK